MSELRGQSCCMCSSERRKTFGHWELITSQDPALRPHQTTNYQQDISSHYSHSCRGCCLLEKMAVMPASVCMRVRLCGWKRGAAWGRETEEGR